MDACSEAEIRWRAAAFVDHVGKDHPALWQYFLEVCGLNAWLAQYLSSSPFAQVPPVERTIWSLVRRENSDIDRGDAAKVFHAVRAIVRNEHLVEEAFAYRDPDYWERQTAAGKTAADKHA
jgi:hypothetical protein